MTTYSFPQGRLFVAPRGASGVNGALVEVGDTNAIKINFTSEKVVVKESQSGQQLKAMTFQRGLEGTIDFTILNIDAANLVKALYATKSTITATAVVDAPFTAYKGGSIGLPPGSTSVAVNKGATPLVLDTDYTYDTRVGRITFLPGSLLVTAVDGTAGDAVVVDYTPVAGEKIEALTAGVKDYYFEFEEVQPDENGQVKRHILHRVALDIVSAVDLVSTEVSKLSIKGDLLPAPEVTATGVSKYYTIIQ